MTTKTKEQKDAATAALAGNHGFSLISDKKLLDLYSAMVKCRMIEEHAWDLFGFEGLGGNRDAGPRREAAAVGAAIDLLPGDTVVASRRDLIANFLKDDPLSRLLSPKSVRAAESSLADLLHLAATAAATSRLKKNGKIAAVFLCGESTSSGTWQEALIKAGADRLPILFVRQTNLPDEAQSGMARDFGFPVIPVDGSDVVAVYRVATEAITHARKGNGATLIECVTTRSGDDAETDPILKMEAYLSRKGLFSEKLKRDVAAAFGRELLAAIERAAPARPSKRSKLAAKPKNS